MAFKCKSTFHLFEMVANIINLLRRHGYRLQEYTFHLFCCDATSHASILSSLEAALRQYMHNIYLHLLALFGFLLSFYTNPWINSVGYFNAYGTMAGISAFIILCGLPLYIYGKRIRHASWHWGVVKYVHWDEDREVGE